MNYHNITSPDMLNGMGLRTVLWVSGCTHNCPGCHNPITHPFNSGIPFTEETYDEIYDKSNHEYISGITFSGGDPLMPQNIDKVTEIAERFKSDFPNKSIWIYTGYKYEQLLNRSDASRILEIADVLVDGRFKIEDKNPLLHFRGSSNQRIIDLKNSDRNSIKILESV